MTARRSKSANAVAEVRSFEGGCLVKLAGDLDESFDADRVLSRVSGDVVVFDLGGVQRVSSFGVRMWLHVVRDLKAQYWAIVGCRPPMVRQIATIQGFMAGGQLLSCYLGFHCDGCGNEVEKLFDLRLQTSLETHREPCPRCQRSMSSDDVSEVRTALTVAAPGKAPPLVDAMLTGKSRPRVESLAEPRPSPAAGQPTVLFKVSLFTPGGGELGSHDCERTGPDELQVHLDNAPLPLNSRVHLNLNDGSPNCSCDVRAGFSKERSWVSVLRLHQPTPKFLAALAALSAGRKTP